MNSIEHSKRDEFRALRGGNAAHEPLNRIITSPPKVALLLERFWRIALAKCTLYSTVGKAAGSRGTSSAAAKTPERNAARERSKFDLERRFSLAGIDAPPPSRARIASGL
jgi:hypothetical protein